MIKLRDISNVNPEEFDEVWIICRSIKKLDRTILDNPKVKHVPDLSPSMELFYAYRKWANQGVWNTFLWNEKYVPNFLEQMRNDVKAKTYLQQLTDESKSKNIALVCFCRDEKMCHRSIVGGILYHMGASIEIKDSYEGYHI